MSEQTITGVAITIALMSFVVMLINMRDHREEPGVVLIVKVHQIGDRLTCHATGPDGGYKLSHSMFAAACLSAEAVRLMDEGVEGGLEVLQAQIMEVLNASR